MIGKGRSIRPSSPKNRKQTKIKFQVSRPSLECFIHKSIGTKSVAKKIGRPQTNRISYHEDKPNIKCKMDKVEKQDENNRLSNSPDMVIVTNTIIKPIQEQGTNFQWKENQSSKQKRCHKTDSSPDENPLFNPTWSFSLSSLGSSKKSLKNSQQTKHSNFSSNNPSTARNFNFINPFDVSGYYYLNTQPQQNDCNVIQNLIVYDSRTTIYIRHIPNKYSLKLLEDQLDKTHKNTYDFLHLPFDYQNNCNRGYAFINFIKIQQISRFYKIYHGRKWNKFNSSKICQIKYACIQGKDSLINHFHDTKVLNEKQKKFRPIFKDTNELEKKKMTTNVDLF